MSLEYKDYYKILGVTKGATQEEITKAYKKLARKHHPDLNQGDKKSEERFKELNEAHEVLKDPEKRKMYDQLGPNWQHGQNFQRPPGFENIRFGGSGADFASSGFSDFFETLFGRGGGFSGASCGGMGGGSPFGRAFNQQPRKGRDVEATLSLTLEEAFHGGKKVLTLSGIPGVGPRSLEVAIPEGVKNGGKIRLSGQGDPGSNGAPAGDLYLKVTLHTHPHFHLDDADIIYDLHLAPWDAALGVTTTVPTLSGMVEIKIAPGTGSGKKLRLRGKGLGSGKSKGDQFVRIAVDAPEPTVPEIKKLWEQLREAAGNKADTPEE